MYAKLIRREGGNIIYINKEQKSETTLDAAEHVTTSGNAASALTSLLEAMCYKQPSSQIGSRALGSTRRQLNTDECLIKPYHDTKYVQLFKGYSAYCAKCWSLNLNFLEQNKNSMTLS